MFWGKDTVVFVNAGPSIDQLAAIAWKHIQNAGEVVAVNGTLVAETCLSNRVEFTCALAMDAGDGPNRGLGGKVPGFCEAWNLTTVWRITKAGPGAPAAETYIRLVESAWCDDPDEGRVGGGSAAGACNWFSNPWPDGAALSELQGRNAGRRVPRRGYRRFAFLGLDMVRGDGRHARGAGTHQSGFISSPERDSCVRQRWKSLCDAAAARGIELLNFSPGTGLLEMPRRDLPAEWLLE